MEAEAMIEAARAWAPTALTEISEAVFVGAVIERSLTFAATALILSSVLVVPS